MQPFPALTHDRASTEPPSEDGGERKPCSAARRADIVLQRSRHPKTAERWIALARGAELSPLQRSRHPKTAERGRLLPQLPEPRRASTEPPSEDGGETLR